MSIAALGFTHCLAMTLWCLVKNMDYKTFTEIVGWSLWLIILVVIMLLFGSLAIIIGPGAILLGIYIWIFIQWIYDLIPKWYKKLGPTYKSVGSYF